MSLLYAVFVWQAHHIDALVYSFAWLIHRTCVFLTRLWCLFARSQILSWLRRGVLLWIVLSLFDELHYKIIKFYFWRSVFSNMKLSINFDQVTLSHLCLWLCLWVIRWLDGRLLCAFRAAWCPRSWRDRPPKASAGCWRCLQRLLRILFQEFTQLPCRYLCSNGTRLFSPYGLWWCSFCFMTTFLLAKCVNLPRECLGTLSGCFHRGFEEISKRLSIVLQWLVVFSRACMLRWLSWCLIFSG